MEIKDHSNARLRKLVFGIVVCGCGNAALAATGPSAIPSDHGYSILSIATGLAIAVAGLLILIKLGRLAIDYLTSEFQLTSLLPGLRPTAGRTEFTEATDFSKLVMELRAGPVPAPRASAVGASPLLSKAAVAPGHDATLNGSSELAEFLARAPGEIAAMLELVKISNRSESPLARHDILAEVYQQIGSFKHRSSLPELRPAWQLATAVEGLLKQLVGRTSNLTQSTLRTLASSLELLRDLSVPGVRTDLVTDPAIRILAVDDDQVCGFAMCAAIKKAFDMPDLAKSGEAALALARKQHYDLIILDVMMPGMDGFEVCSMIREIAPNRSTPVLFVTTLKDFDARTKSLAAGGNEIMGKPFLAFEITVKALTMILRARLHERNRPLDLAGPSVPAGTPAVRWPSLTPAPAPEVDDSAPPIDLPLEQNVENSAKTIVPKPVSAYAATAPAKEDRRGSSGKTPGELSAEFLAYVESSIADMTGQIKTIGQTEEGPVRLEMLMRLDLRLKSFGRLVHVPELRPAFELCTAIEGLVKKFRENSKNVTISALGTAATALELLGDLCAPGVKPDLASNPAIRMLVVDDEPLARRAVAGALQTAFSRPASAESGEAALALAMEQEFDLVFSDVSMPGMDGFALCNNLHKTVPNRATPVIFVTSHSDEEFRAQAARCGGRDFVVKPFVFAEITVKALTFALRGRMEKIKMAQSQEKNQ
jgi:DNA-binding response OmpR family regulator